MSEEHSQSKITTPTDMGKMAFVVPEDREASAEFAGTVHGYLLGQIQLADAKAALLFAATSAALGYLHEKAPGFVTRPILTNALTTPRVILIGAAIALLIGAILALVVILPRFGGAVRGLIYWRAVAGKGTAADYAASVLGAGPSGLLEEHLKHCHELARICRRKFIWLNASLWCGGIGLLLSVLFLVVTLFA